jgi:hypothetical protein
VSRLFQPPSFHLCSLILSGEQHKSRSSSYVMLPTLLLRLYAWCARRNSVVKGPRTTSWAIIRPPSKGKSKFICVLNHHTTKAYWETEVQPHTILTSAPNWGEWLVTFIPRPLCTQKQSPTHTEQEAGRATRPVWEQWGGFCRYKMESVRRPVTVMTELPGSTSQSNTKLTINRLAPEFYI